MSPNIIYVFADQLRLQSCGYAGDALAQTPNIDALVKQSMNFQNAVVSMPVCSAYRASLLTGKYVTSHGMVINELRLNPDHHPHPLANCITAAGYDTAYIGKWHVYANKLGKHHDPKNSFVPRGPDRLGFDGFWAAYNFHHEYYNTNSEDSNCYYHTESPKKIPVPAGVYEPDYQTDMAIDYLNSRVGNEQPFFMVLSIGTPHDPWDIGNVPADFYAKFKDVEFPRPANFSTQLDPHGDQWSNGWLSDGNIDEDLKWAEVQQLMRVYYAMTTNLDMNIGRLQRAIREAGIEDNTLFVFTSDHGEMFGSQGRMKKNIFYEEAARVPFLIKWPAAIPAGSRSDVCFNCVDIMPTLLGLTGIDIPDDVEGMDLSHCALGQAGPEPEFALLQNTGACALWENGHEWRAIRDKQFTYAIFKSDGQELLFDNINDPQQLNNLIGNSMFQERLITMRSQLKQKMTEINDAFPDSRWYEENWISKDRIIMRTATCD